IVEPLYPFVLGSCPDRNLVLVRDDLHFLAKALPHALEQRIMIESGNRPDVDADLREIGHRVDVEPTFDRADVERGLAHYRMLGAVEIEGFETRDRVRRLVDRV